MVSTAVSRTLRYLAGIENPEEEEQQPGLLDTLGQGIGNLAAGAQEAAGAAGYAVGSGLRSAAETAGSYLPSMPEIPEERPPQYSGPSYAQPGISEPPPPPVPPYIEAATAPARRVYGEAIEQANADADAFEARIAPGMTDVGRAINEPWSAVNRGLRVGRDALMATPQAVADTIDAGLSPVGLGRESVGLDVPVVGRVGIADVVDLPGPMQGLTSLGMGRSSVLRSAPTRVGQAIAEQIPNVAAPVEQAAGTAVRAGAEALGDVSRRIGTALGRNAEQVAAADARMAAEGSVAAPGVFGVSGLTPDRPEVAGLRPRIIPTDVADELDYPINVPTDPSVVRAIEAAGGTVDERGTTLNVIRMHDPEAAGGAATRSMVFYTAGPPGSPSPYARQGTVGPQGVGGQQRIEGPTRFRNPLFIAAAPGEAPGFDDAMRQMVPEGAGSGQFVITNRRSGNTSQAFASSDEAERYLAGMPESIRPNLVVRERPNAPPPTAVTVEDGIRAAKRAGPAGSPARAEALKTLVTRYGGDPDAIDDLIDLRGAETGESVYAVKENIVAGNARRAGHDGVIALSKRPADAAEIAAHPRVVEAERVMRDANAAENAAIGEADRLRDAGRRRGDPEYDAAWQRYERAAERTRAALNEQYAAERQAREELAPREITELADPREWRNPTPGASIVSEQSRAAHAAALVAQERAADQYAAAGEAYYAIAEREGFASAAARGAEERMIVAGEEWERLSNVAHAVRPVATSIGPPGYTLRPDIPRRPGTSAAASQAAETAEEARLAAQADAAFNHPEVQAAGRRAQEAEAAYQAAKARWQAGDVADRTELDAAFAARGEALAAHAEVQRRVLHEMETGSTTAQASAGALPAPSGLPGALPAVNRALSQGVVSSVSGGVGAQVNQEMNPDDPYAGIKGFAAGALVPPLAQRGARALARAAGAGPSPGGGAAATLGAVPGDGGAARRARLAAQRAAATPQIAALAGQAAQTPMTGPHTNGQHVTRNVARQVQKQAAAGVPPQTPTAPMPPPDPPPSWWDHMENWRYNVGLFAQLSTGMVQAAGGVVQAIGGGAAEALRLGVLKGQPEALLPIAAEVVKSVPGALKSTALTAVGQVPKAIQAGSDYKPPVHAREFAQGNVGRGAASLLVGTPGRIMTQAPDALWYEMFQKAGIAQAAADEAQRQVGSSPLQMGQRLRIQQALIQNPTPEIEAEATKLAQNATYKGEPGRVLGVPKQVTEALGPVGSFFMPIYNTIARIHEQALEYTPGVGMLPLEKIGLAPKNQARPVSRRIAQQAVGASVVLGGLSYAAEGGIRGPGPSNPNEAQAMRDQGYTPNTTNVGGYWIPNTWFGPWGPILNEIGAVNDARLYDHGDKGWDDLTWEKKAASIIKMSGRAAADYPALETAQTITKLFTAPEDALPSFLGEVAAQYLPGPLRTKAMAEDTKARTRTRGPDVPFEQRVEETVRQRSGVGREQLPVAQDILGRDVANPRQGWGRALAPNLREEKPDPIIQAYLDADLNIGDPATELTVPSLKDTDLKPRLTPEETRRWNTLRGESIIRRTEIALADPRWAERPPENRQQFLEKARTSAAEEAHARLRSEIGAQEITRRISEARATKQRRAS